MRPGDLQTTNRKTRKSGQLVFEQGLTAQDVHHAPRSEKVGLMPGVSPSSCIRSV